MGFPLLSQPMTTFLVGTDSVSTSQTLAGYLEDRLTADDELYAVNSLYGGDDTSDGDVVDGEKALRELAERFDAETHQFVRGNSPQEDLMQFADERDADELVIGIRKRSPTGKVIFGSTAQDLLLSSSIPVVCVPLTG